MIVFPEYGITGLKLSNKTIIHFLEFVPNPYEYHIIPCNQTELKDSPILQRLSCLARKHSIIIVANLAASEPCKKNLQDPNCPPDGMYKYNTDIAFGTDGELLAKYNKENLFSDEKHMFQPGKGVDNLAVFRTEFGVFGLFTCFDMLFKQPAEYLIHGMEVTNMIFPTAWMNELPLLSAEEYQQAWAIRFDVNLLASNIQFPLALMTGGGLYAGTKGAVVYHHDMMDFKGKLLIGQLPIRIQRTPRMTSASFKDLSKQIKNLTTEELRKVSPVVKAILLEGTQFSLVNETVNKISDSTHQTHPQPLSCGNQFTSLMNHDPYTFVLLTQNAGSTSVCSKNLCCHLNYTFNTTSLQRGMFALGVFNGLHMNNGQFYVQTCALVKCKFDTKWSCGAEAVHSNTRFSYFSLAGEGFDRSTMLFPSALTSDVHLPVIGKEWESVFPYDHVWSVSGTRDPLLEVSIFGRWYDED